MIKISERKIQVEEGKAETREDVAVETAAQMKLMLRELVITETMRQKITQVSRISDLVRKFGEKLKQFNN